MHVRRKGVQRTEEKLYVGGDEIKVVEEDKYGSGWSESSI